MILAWIPAAAAQECDAMRSLQEVEEALRSAVPTPEERQRLQPDDVRATATRAVVARATIAAAVPCLPKVDRSLAARIHGLRATAAYYEAAATGKKPELEADVHLRAMRRADPSVPLVYRGDLARRAVNIVNEPGNVALSAPRGTVVVVDGRENAWVARGEPALVQLTAGDHWVRSRLFEDGSQAQAWLNQFPTISAVSIEVTDPPPLLKLGVEVSGWSGTGVPGYHESWRVAEPDGEVRLQPGPLMDLAPGTRLEVTVTPFDGLVSGPPVSDSVTVGPRPGMPTVAFTPGSEVGGHHVECVVTRSQEGGGGGELVGSLTGPGVTFEDTHAGALTLRGTVAHAGEVWECKAFERGKWSFSELGGASLNVKAGSGSALIVAGAATGVLAIAGLGVARSWSRDYDDVDNPDITTRRELDELRDRTNALAGASVGVGVVGSGLLVWGLVIAL